MKIPWTRHLPLLLHRRGRPCPKTKGWNGPKESPEGGFTLVELLIVITIVPVIIGSLAAGLMAVFSLQSGVSNRISNSGEAQAMLSVYTNDVQSAQFITTQSSSSPQCGTGNQLLGLEWDPASSGGFLTMVSYDLVPPSGGATASSLIRQYCTGGSSTPTSTTTISYNFSNSQVPPTLTPALSNTAAQAGWTTAQSVTTVGFAITQPEGPNNVTPYVNTLVASPAASASVTSNGGPITTATTTRCNFASTGGTYVSTLCFVDFSTLSTPAGKAAVSAAGTCLEMSVSLPQNYTMFFCIHISGHVWSVSGLPTWQSGCNGNICSGGAFLGNNVGGSPFYFGVAGSPAIYQIPPNGGSTTVISITGITVVNPQGINATGWQAVAADSETTDQNESITFTSDQNLNLLWNSPTSPVGNACGSNGNNDGTYNHTYLTGVGTTTVKCFGPVSSNKTGTTMVWAPTPSMLTTILDPAGNGLEGMTFGLLLSGGGS
jgi:prepilin-type N-terminal cleavage/methylation domain-containing protein